MEQETNEHNIDIELSEEMALGVYSNIVVVNHSPSEFVVDFIQMMPGVPKARVRSRVLLTPQHAKRLVKVLYDNVQNFEQQFGEIVDYDTKQPFNFVVPNTEA